uniref:Uncharacterized protein n=1 Tax=Arundo donax TaxID=35708 RepID=A0A0A9AW94_ARUDO
MYVVSVYYMPVIFLNQIIIPVHLLSSLELICLGFSDQDHYHHGSKKHFMEVT